MATATNDEIVITTENDDDVAIEVLIPSAESSALHANQKRVRIKKRKKSSMTIGQLRLLPTTAGTATFWKDRFVSDVSAKKYVSIIVEMYQIVCRYYCIIDGCRDEFNFPTHAGQALEHVASDHPANYATIQSKKTSSTSTTAKEKVDRKRPLLSIKSTFSQQRHISDFTSSSYKRTHPK